ncbi:MAG: hypothetical protein UT62_C0021G0007, partial [Parcubacteria group bacterium GW2011_GWC1_39_8]
KIPIPADTAKAKRTEFGETTNTELVK